MFHTKAVTIKVSDVNEPPTSIKLSGSQTVRATAEPGHVIGQLIVDDEDTIQTHSFTILGANSDLVEVSHRFYTVQFKLLIIILTYLNCLTHNHTIPHFDTLKIYSFGKHLYGTFTCRLQSVSIWTCL